MNNFYEKAIYKTENNFGTTVAVPSYASNRVGSYFFLATLNGKWFFTNANYATILL